MARDAQIAAGGLGARGGPLCAAVVGIVLAVVGLGLLQSCERTPADLTGGYEAVEAPPAEYDGQPGDVAGITEHLLDSKGEVDRLCRAKLGAQLAEGEYFRACYVPTEGLIVLPSRRAVSGDEQRALRSHEWAHARGWRHPLTKAQIAAIRRQLGFE